MSEVLITSCGTVSFSGKELPSEALLDILTAALRTAGSPSNSLNLYATENAMLLRQLADSRDDAGAGCLSSAAVAVAVAVDRLYDGSWVENAAAAAWMMRVEAAALGVSCRVVQVRGFSLSDGTLSDEVVRGILGIPESQTVYALVALGYADTASDDAAEAEADFSRVHIVD